MWIGVDSIRIQFGLVRDSRTSHVTSCLMVWAVRCWGCSSRVSCRVVWVGRCGVVLECCRSVVAVVVWCGVVVLVWCGAFSLFRSVGVSAVNIVFHSVVYTVFALSILSFVFSGGMGWIRIRICRHERF